MALLHLDGYSCLDVCLVEVVNHIGVGLVLAVSLDTRVVDVRRSGKVLVLGSIGKKSGG